MERILCKSKIHAATLTETLLYYEGSIEIDRDLMDRANLLPYEKVQVVNIANGHRIETYIIEGARGTGKISLNGAAARWAHAGDQVIIMAYAVASEEEARNWKPTIVLVDENNRVKQVK